MPVKCTNDCGNAAILKVNVVSKFRKYFEEIHASFIFYLSCVFQRPKTGDTLCKECFFSTFEAEVHDTIVKSKLFKSGDKVAIAASGGKDSTVLAYILKLLNQRHKYGLDLFLLSIDEGITGSLTCIRCS